MKSHLPEFNIRKNNMIKSVVMLPPLVMWKNEHTIFNLQNVFLLYVFKMRSMDEWYTLYDYRYIFHMYILIYSRREHIHLIHPYLIISTSFICSSVWWLMLSLFHLSMNAWIMLEYGAVFAFSLRVWQLFNISSHGRKHG